MLNKTTKILLTLTLLFAGRIYADESMGIAPMYNFGETISLEIPTTASTVADATAIEGFNVWLFNGAIVQSASWSILDGTVHNVNGFETAVIQDSYTPSATGTVAIRVCYVADSEVSSEKLLTTKVTEIKDLVNVSIDLSAAAAGFLQADDFPAPQMYFPREVNEATRTFVCEALSKSATEPYFECAVVGGSNDVTYATDTNFMHTSYQRFTDSDGEAIYAHLWYKEIGENQFPQGWYRFLAKIGSIHGYTRAVGCSIVVTPTPEIDTSVLADNTDIANIDSWFKKMATKPQDSVLIYDVVEGVTRAGAGLSDMNNRYVPPGQRYCLVVSVTSPIDDSGTTVYLYPDYSETTNLRSTYIEAATPPATQATDEGVTIKAAGVD